MTISEAFEARTITLLGEGIKEKTVKNYRVAEHSLIMATGNIPIELIGSQQIAVWRMKMSQAGNTNTTIHTNFAKLKSVLKFLLDNDMPVMSPTKIKSPKLDTAPRTVLTPTEIQLLINAAKNPRDKAIIAVTFLTLARISEVLSIDKDQLDAPVDSSGQQKVWVCGKGGKYRPLIMNAIARRYIDEYLKTRRNPATGELDCFKPLFMSGQHRRITVSRVEQIIHECSALAGLEKRVTPHILRHSSITDLLNNSAPIEHVSKLAGHANVTITSKIYSHVNNDSLSATIQRYQSQIS